MHPDHRYIIWLRNPLSRFVSAFNFSYALINWDTSKLNVDELTIENSLAPARMRYRMEHDHTFSAEYDELITYFETPNRLAESLSHDDPVILERAWRLMKHPLEHISRGIGWYLDDGEFVSKHSDQILFVGRVETMKSDMATLARVVGIPLDVRGGQIRKNRMSLDTVLSHLAVGNLHRFYRATDYRAWGCPVRC